MTKAGFQVGGHWDGQVAKDTLHINKYFSFYLIYADETSQVLSCTAILQPHPWDWWWWGERGKNKMNEKKKKKNIVLVEALW